MRQPPQNPLSYTPPGSGVIDLGTRSDELLIQQVNQNVSIIEQNSSIIEQNSLILEALQSIQSNTTTTPIETPEKSLLITYPEDGTTKTVAAGYTTLNFHDGTVSLPTGGSPENMSTSLHEHPEVGDLCHSLVIHANHEFSIRLDDSGALPGRSTILPTGGSAIYLSEVDFKSIRLYTARETILYAAASTSPRAPEIKPDVVRIIGNTSGDGTGTDYIALVNAYGELLTSTRAVRATLLDNAAIASGGTTSAANITTIGHTMFVQIVMDDVGEFTVLSSPDNVTYYEQETIAINEIGVGGVATFRPAHEYTAVRNDSPDTLTGTIILGVF